MEDFISINEDDDDLVPLPIDWTTLPRKSNLTFLEKDDSSRQILLPSMPWKDWNEFKYVYYNLFDHFYKINGLINNETETEKHLKSKDDSLINLKHSYNIIEMWRTRHFNNLPICIDVTQQVLHSLYLFAANNGNNEILRRLLSINISRLTNRLIDPKYNKSTVFWSKQMSYPVQLIAIRHNIIHEHLPSIYTLKQHSILLLKWLNTNYWKYQINKINNICNTNLIKLLTLKNKKNTFTNKDCDEIIHYLKNNLANNCLSTMQYFIPHFIDKCLINIDISAFKLNKKENIIQQLFTLLFVKYNSLIQRLLQRHPSLIAYFVVIILQKRYKIMISRDLKTNPETDGIKCSLMVLWCCTLLMDDDNKKIWKNAFNKNELIFVFNNALKFVINFNDYWSKEIIKNIKKKAKQFHIENDIIILKSINAIQNYVKPLMRNVKSDECINNLIKHRLDAQQLDNKLMCDCNAYDDEDDDKMDDDEDSDTDTIDQDNQQKTHQMIKCKWKKTNECKFLPIGHSVLPPL